MAHLTAALPPLSFRIRDESKALVSSVAFTVAFTAVYTVIAPIALVVGVLGGPVWAACFGLWQRRAR